MVTRSAGVGVLLCALFLSQVGCGSSTATTPRRLASGVEIQVISAGAVDGTWQIAYCTRLALNPRGPLAQEVETLWRELRVDADLAGVRRAYLTPTVCASRIRFAGWRPVVLSDEATAFTLEKDKENVWQKKSGWVQ